MGTGVSEKGVSYWLRIELRERIAIERMERERWGMRARRTGTDGADIGSGVNRCLPLKPYRLRRNRSWIADDQPVIVREAISCIGWR